MKRISILSALLLMCAMTFAQQALWGGASFYRERTSHRCGNPDITAYRYCCIGEAVCLRE